MKRRILVLMLVLVVRLVVGGLWSGECAVGEKVKIKGEIAETGWREEKQVLSVGVFRVVAEGGINYKKGDEVVIEGECVRRARDFLLGRVWLGEADVEIVGKAGVVNGGVREKLVEIYRKQLPEPEAGLVAGVVLGEKSSLGQDFYDALIETGTVHVVVASGYNVVVVGMVVFNLLIYFWKRPKATIGAILAMAGYALLAGGDPPVVRAVVMAGLVFWARAVGRQSSTGWLLFLAAWMMVMVEPELVESVSFQLSVAATVGLVWLEPNLREWMGKVKTGWMRVVLMTELSPTLAAQITTGPIVWWNFGRISLISPLVNVLVLPLVPVMMGLGAIQLVLGRVVAPFTYAIAHLFVVIVGWFG